MQLPSLITKSCDQLVPTYGQEDHLTPLEFKMASLFLLLVLYKTFSLQYRPWCRLARAHSRLTLNQTTFFTPTAFISMGKSASNLFTTKFNALAWLCMLAQAFQTRQLKSLSDVIKVWGIMTPFITILMSLDVVAIIVTIQKVVDAPSLHFYPRLISRRSLASLASNQAHQQPRLQSQTCSIRFLTRIVLALILQ
jgi:hypothetical protein